MLWFKTYMQNIKHFASQLGNGSFDYQAMHKEMNVQRQPTSAGCSLLRTVCAHTTLCRNTLSARLTAVIDRKPTL